MAEMTFFLREVFLVVTISVNAALVALPSLISREPPDITIVERSRILAASRAVT